MKIFLLPVGSPAFCPQTPHLPRIIAFSVLAFQLPNLPSLWEHLLPKYLLLDLTNLLYIFSPCQFHFYLPKSLLQNLHFLIKGSQHVMLSFLSFPALNFHFLVHLLTNHLNFLHLLWSFLLVFFVWLNYFPSTCSASWNNSMLLALRAYSSSQFFCIMESIFFLIELHSLSIYANLLAKLSVLWGLLNLCWKISFISCTFSTSFWFLSILIFLNFKQSLFYMKIYT